MRKLCILAALLGCGCGVSIAQYVGPSPTVPFRGKALVDTGELDRLLTAPEPAKVLEMDDVFNVQVYGVKDFNLQRRVGQDGMVSLPLVGSLCVQGLTIEQVEKQLAGELRNGGFVQDAQVTVTIVSQPSLTVAVTGEVAKPGMFAAFGRHTLSDYLAQAGGLKDTASSTVTLIRHGLPGPVEVPLGPDPRSSHYAEVPIFPGDEIRAGRVGVIYVVGALKNQGAFPLKNTTPTTVMNAVTLAGGMGYEAASRNASIFRTDGDHRVETKVDVGRIMKGKAEDIALRSDDILFIPTNKMRAAVKGGGASLAVGLASAYIYAHP
ncbi:MAG TPA: polysaccharide biosynthesis/export family protein [Acidobacteriaceae bacterium]|jgi:polysaccharide export outer membrane protein